MFTKKTVCEPLYPGEVLNGDILDDTNKYYLRANDSIHLRTPLKLTLEENKDYIVLNSKCGKMLYKLFGGVPIIRNTITKGKRVTPIIYPPFVFLFLKCR